MISLALRSSLLYIELLKKVKVPWGADVVTISAQEDLNVAAVEGLEAAVPLSGFQVAVIDDAVINENKRAVNRMSPFSRKMMKKMQWKYNKGLGRDLQGRLEPVPSSHGQQGRRGLGYSEHRKKEKYEVQSPIKEPGPNKIFFIPEASGEFQSRGKTYPGLEIFMIDFEEQLIKSPEPSFEQLVEGTQFMVDMVQTGSGTEWSQKIPEFEDFVGSGDEDSRMVQERKSKSRILQSILAAEDAEEAERKVMKMPKHEEKEEKAALEAEDAPDANEVIQAIKDSCDECIEQAINR
ncbi:hypothetical protein JCGZ_10408 [Jatropha curcas]|uniref:G-patch domain-containing protein n=1 Tax=Jatropha curcas TaxID=180498 RepID=A0A067KVX7_JATCU|nr:hypothetical protein JCGZ_10408 [Jatropha curcas]